MWESASVLAMTIVGTLRPVLAFAMIASESDKRLGWFQFVWQHGHVPLHHKYEPRRRRKLEKFFSKTQKYFTCQPSCEAEWEYGLVACKAHDVCFKMIGKCLKISKTNSNISFHASESTEHEEETKLNHKNSTSPHTEIVFVKHNEILPCSLVSTRCDSRWNAPAIMRAKFEKFGEPDLFFKETDGLLFYDGIAKTSFAIMDGAVLVVCSLLDFCTFFFKFSL